MPGKVRWLLNDYSEMTRAGKNGRRILRFATSISSPVCVPGFAGKGRTALQGELNLSCKRKQRLGAPNSFFIVLSYAVSSIFLSEEIQKRY